MTFGGLIPQALFMHTANKHQKTITPRVSFNTPRSIAAYCEAEADRRRWFRGEASEQHISEPLANDADTVPYLVIPRGFRE